MSDVNGTPRSPNDPNDDQHTHERGPARLWRAFVEWVDDYAWTIITLGVALILLDVLFVLVVLLWQVNR